MKAKKYFILLAVVAGILYSSVQGEERLIEENYGGGLIGRNNPALAGIERLAVVIVTNDAEPNKEGLAWTELNTKVLERLNKAGIKIIAAIAGNVLNIIELRINIDILKLADLQQNAFHIQTSLSRAVCLAEDHRLLFKADVWDTEPVMRVASVQNMPQEVTSVVLEQVEAFIHAYLAANPKDADSTKSKDVSTTYQKKVAPVVKPIAAEYQYVASKNSKVFHKLDCSSAGKTKTENRIFYNSREEAIQDGRRPCKLCNP
jgi:hypothetical protein